MIIISLFLHYPFVIICKKLFILQHHTLILGVSFIIHSWNYMGVLTKQKIFFYKFQKCSILGMSVYVVKPLTYIPTEQ